MKDISVSFVATGLIQALNIATGLLAARLLLPEGRGELAAIMLWPGLIAEIGNLGLLDALLFRGATRTASPRELFAATMTLTIGLSVILVGVGLIVLRLVFGNHTEEVQTIAVYFLCGFVPTYLTSLFTSGLFQGQLQITTWNVLRLIVPLAYLAAILLFTVAAGASVAHFAAAFIIAQAVGGTAGIALLARRGWAGFRPRLAVIKSLVIYGIKVHIGDILYSLRQRLDQAVIALWLPSADLGLYVVSLTVANGPLILIFTVANVAFPKISQQGTTGGKLVVFGRYLRFSMAMTIGTVIALWILVPWLLPLLFGKPFAPAVPIANILLAGTLPLSAKMMLQQALKAWDRSLVVSRAELCGLATALVLLAILMPRFGLYGVAWSLVLSQLVAAGVMAWSLRRDLGLPLLPLLVPTRDDWEVARRGFARVAAVVGRRHG